MNFFNLLHKRKDFHAKITSQFSKNTIKVDLLWTKKTESKNIMLALCIGYLLAYLGKKAHLCTESLKWFSIESHSTEYISSLLCVLYTLRFLKFRQSQNDFFKRTFLPKNELTNSTLLLVDFFRLFFWKKVKTPKRHFEINWPLVSPLKFLVKS